MWMYLVCLCEFCVFYMKLMYFAQHRNVAHSSSSRISMFNSGKEGLDIGITCRVAARGRHVVLGCAFGFLLWPPVRIGVTTSGHIIDIKST